MAVIPWRSPGPDDPALAFLLKQVHDAQLTLDRAVAEVQALPDTDLSRAARLARYNGLQREIRRTYDQVTRLARGWATVDLPGIYAEGHLAAALQSQTELNFTLAHKQAIAVVSADAYQDVATGLQQVPREFNLKVAAQRQLERLSDDRRGLIQIASRDLVAQQLILGELSPADAARRLRDQLWKNGVEVIDRRGRRWDPEAYSRMLIRTKSANAFNVGTLNKVRTDGVSRVLVFDGTQDPDCARANGQIWTLDYAYSHVISHPNCRRAFAPQPGRGVLHRATLQETARVAGITVADQLLIAAILRAARSWDARGAIAVVPRPLREALDKFEITSGILEHLEYLEAWATDQFMPVVEALADIDVDRLGERLLNEAKERLARRSRPVRQYALQLMAQDPLPIRVTAPQSQAVRSAARTVRERLGTEQIADLDRLIEDSGVRGLDDQIDELIEMFEEDAIQVFELTDAMRAHGGAGMDELAALIDEASEADVAGLIAKHFAVNTLLGGGANGTVPVITLDNVEYIVKHVNASVNEVWPVFVSEEWTTYLARHLNLPRLDTALVRIDEDGTTGIIMQPLASGWRTVNEIQAGDVHRLVFEGSDAGRDQARRLSILDMLIENSDQHDGNWLVSAQRLQRDEQIKAAQLMMIDMEITFGVPWTSAPGFPSDPPMGPAEIRRRLSLPAKRADVGAYTRAVAPNVTPAENNLYATVRLTPQENEFLREILRGEHDDALIRIASAVDADDLARLPAAFLDDVTNPDRPWVPILEKKISQIKNRIRRNLAVGYLDDGTRTMEFAGRQLTVGEVAQLDLVPDVQAPGPFDRGFQNPWRVWNSTDSPQLAAVDGTVWNMWEDVDGTKWVAVAHGLPAHGRGAQQTFQGFKVLGEPNVVRAGEVAVPPTPKVQLSPLVVDEEVSFVPIRHDWTPPRSAVDLTDLQREQGINEIQGILDTTIQDILLTVPNALAPSEVRLARIEVDGVEIPGAYHPRGAQADHEFLQELAQSGGVVVNPERLIDGLEGFWAAWKGGRTDDAVAALDTTRFERVLRHELGHAVAEARSDELATQTAAVAFNVITQDEAWMREIMGFDVDLEDLRNLTLQQLRAIVQPEVDRYVERVTQKVQATLRDEVRRVMQERYGVTKATDVGRLPEWLRYAGNVFMGQHPGLDPLREFEGDLIGHLLERGQLDELTRLEKLFTLTDLPDLPVNRQELEALEDWLKLWFYDNRLPSPGLQLMADQTGLPQRRVRRITEFQNVPGEITEKALIRRVYAHEFDEFTTTVFDIIDDGLSIRIAGEIYAKVFDPAVSGPRAGTFQRIIRRQNDGTVSVIHSSLFLDEPFQGKGWGTEFFEWTEDWYVAKGVKEIQVDAVQVGGYNWARRGYDFKDPNRSVAFLRPDNLVRHVRVRSDEFTQDFINQLIMHTWLRNEQFVWDHLESVETHYVDLWRFTEHVRDNAFYEYNGIELADFTREIGEGAVEWKGVAFDDALRSKLLYQVITEQPRFVPTLASEVLRWSAMGFVPLRRAEELLDITSWNTLIRSTYADELETFRLRTGRSFKFVEDSVISHSGRFGSVGGAITSVRDQARAYIPQEWTAFRISQIGAGHPLPDQTMPGGLSWVGKRLLLNEQWEGVKPLEALRQDHRREIFRQLTADEIASTTPMLELVHRRPDLEHLRDFIETTIIKLEQAPTEVMVVPQGDSDPSIWYMFERIGDQVRFIRSGSNPLWTEPEDVVAWAKDTSQGYRREIWFNRPPNSTIDQWDRLKNSSDAIRFDSDEVGEWEQVLKRFVNALDPDNRDVSVRDSMVLTGLFALNKLMELGIPGVAEVTEYAVAFDALRRLSTAFDALADRAGTSIGEFIVRHLRLATNRSSDRVPDDLWTRGTMVREYAGATTYYAINSQLRRERGVHNMSLAMQRALRRDYDAGPPYIHPGWEVSFRQTSLPLSHWEQFIGDEFISESYMSTAYTPHGIGGFAGTGAEDVMIMVRLPEELQRNARYVNNPEQEVLFAPGSRFAVRGIVDTELARGYTERTHKLVVIDYLGQVDRDIPAFGGWQPVRRDFQYVANIHRGDSIRYLRRPIPTAAEPAGAEWQEAIVVGVDANSVSIVRFEDGELRGGTTRIYWTDIFQMDRARPLDVDPPLLAATNEGFRVVDEDEFRRMFEHTLGRADAAMVNRASHMVRFELQTGQVVEGRIALFATALTRTRATTDAGIVELGSVRRFQVSANPLPIKPFIPPEDHVIRELVHAIELSLFGELRSRQHVAMRFRDLARILEDNPSILEREFDGYNYYLVEENLLTHALLGGIKSEFTMMERTDMFAASYLMRERLGELARALERFDGMEYFSPADATQLREDTVARFLRRMAEAIDSNGVVAQGTAPSTGGAAIELQVKVAVAKALHQLNDNMPVDVDGDVFELTLGELIDRIRFEVDRFIDSGFDASIAFLDTNYWTELFLGATKEQLMDMIGPTFWNAHLQALADHTDALSYLTKAIHDLQFQATSVVPKAHEVLTAVANLLENPGVIQLPVDINKTISEVEHLLDNINLTALTIADEVEQAVAAQALLGQGPEPQGALLGAIGALKEQVDNDPIVVENLSQVFEKLNEVVQVEGMSVDDLLDFLRTKFGLDSVPASTIDASEVLIEKLVNTISSLDIESESNVADALQKIWADSDGLMPAMSVVEKLFELDPLELDDAFTVGEKAKLFNELIDALNDPAVNFNIQKLIQLLNEMAGVGGGGGGAGGLDVSGLVADLKNTLDQGGWGLQGLINTLNGFNDDILLITAIDPGFAGPGVSVPVVELIFEELGVNDDDIAPLAAHLEDLIDEAQVETIEELRFLLEGFV